VLDPYEVLGLQPGVGPDEVRTVGRRLQIETHPDRFPGASAAERAALTRRTAEVSQAVHILTNANALRRWEARRARAARRSGTPDRPGADGVRFTAGPRAAGWNVEPAPGDPDFDYRQRAAVEFEVRPEPPLPPRPWTARQAPRRRWPRS
jgi:curved DNA-binding protein CbpA